MGRRGGEGGGQGRGACRCALLLQAAAATGVVKDYGQGRPHGQLKGWRFGGTPGDSRTQSRVHLLASTRRGLALQGALRWQAGAACPALRVHAWPHARLPLPASAPQARRSKGRGRCGSGGRGGERSRQQPPHRRPCASRSSSQSWGKTSCWTCQSRRCGLTGPWVGGRAGQGRGGGVQGGAARAPCWVLR